jgi:hypothetical protein
MEILHLAVSGQHTRANHFKVAAAKAGIIGPVAGIPEAPSTKSLWGVANS